MGRRCHPFHRWQYANIKLQFHIDSYAVGSDQGLLAGALHFDAVGPHIDFVDFVQERQGYTTAGEDDLLPAETGARQRHVAAGFAIEVIQKDNTDCDHDNRNYDTQ